MAQLEETPKNGVTNNEAFALWYKAMSYLETNYCKMQEDVMNKSANCLIIDINFPCFMMRVINNINSPNVAVFFHKKSDGTLHRSQINIPVMEWIRFQKACPIFPDNRPSI